MMEMSHNIDAMDNMDDGNLNEENQKEVFTPKETVYISNLNERVKIHG
jgi:hypothetical protein